MKKRAHIPTAEGAEDSQALCDDFRLEQKASIQNTLNSKVLIQVCRRRYVAMAAQYWLLTTAFSSAASRNGQVSNADATTQSPRHESRAKNGNSLNIPSPPT